MRIHMYYKKNHHRDELPQNTWKAAKYPFSNNKTQAQNIIPEKTNYMTVSINCSRLTLMPTNFQQNKQITNRTSV